MIKERPILFSTPMVQAILAGRKTMTRRTNGLEYVNKNPNARTSARNTEDNLWHFTFWDGGTSHPIIKCPYGQIGDVLWVRETFTEWPKGEYQYKCGTAFGEELGKWKPSIHMPKFAARIWLEITNIRVERLQDITEQDAIAEGVENMLAHIEGAITAYFKYDVTKEEQMQLGGHWSHVADDAVHSFQSLWQSINGKQSWDDNPWVWVVEFKQIDKSNIIGDGN